MKYLALWFEAPLQSWGVDSKFSLRTTFSFPTKSGIAGIILASLGRGGEEVDFLKRFGSFEEIAISYCYKEKKDFASQTTDFQVIGNGYDKKDLWQKNMIPKKRDGSDAVGGGSKLVYKHYIQDGFFGVVQEVDEDICLEIKNGLINPIWPIFLGRRCCVPTYPIFQGKFDTKEDALDKLIEIATSKELIEKERLVEGSAEEADDTFFIQDVPVKFGKHKEYRDREVSIIRS